jgi:hypothetical protein
MQVFTYFVKAKNSFENMTLTYFGNFNYRNHKNVQCVTKILGAFAEALAFLYNFEHPDGITSAGILPDTPKVRKVCERECAALSLST